LRTDGLTLDAWKLLLEDLLAQIQAIVPLLRLVVEARSLEPCAAKLGNLIKSSEACGFWTLYDVLNELVGAADNQQWIRVHNLSASVALADKFVMHMIEPDRFQSGFVDADQFGVERIVRDPSSWLSDDILQRCPLADHDGALARVMRLGSFPVGEGKAAAFRLAADGRGASIQNVLDVVRSDPPLGALLVQSVNKRTDDPDSMIEDSLQAVQMLGGFKLREAATQMNVVEEKCFDLPPIVNSHRFWMYQYGCAQVCEFVCEFMEIPIFMPHAYWAGMYHDLGKSALAMAYPESFVAAAKLSHELSIPMNDAYVKLIGITPSEAGAALARSCHLPPWVVNVMRHVRKPEAAVEDRELVHIVSFCSNLCLRYEIGSNGDLPPPPDMPLDAFPGWAVMSQRVFPSFDIRRFGDVMASWSADLLKNMSGRGSFVTD
jgi:HD-like signal output (HDOD) protein